MTYQYIRSLPLFTIILFAIISCTKSFTIIPSIQISSQSQQHNLQRRRIQSALSTASVSSDGGGEQSSAVPRKPQTFREGEIMGLRLMQDGRHEDALNAFKQAMKLPGTRSDIVRRANVPGPSPVGGSKGGTEAEYTQTLDEFEYQAAHYNMACAYASLGNVGEAVANLKKAFDYGFDNYATVRSDPDLANAQGSAEFNRLMDEVDPQRGFPFNPFGK